MLNIKLTQLKQINQVISCPFLQGACITNTNVSKSVNTAPVPEVFASESETKPVEPTSDHAKTYINAKLVPDRPKENILEHTWGAFTRLDNFNPLGEVEGVRRLLPFEAMPGPQSLQYVSKLLDAIPILNSQSVKDVVGADIFGFMNWYDNMKLFKRFASQYGPVVRLQGPFGGNVVILTLLQDAMALIQNEGPFPIRSTLHTLQQYCLSDQNYKQTGPFLTSGPEWKTTRTAIEHALKNSLRHQFRLVEKASGELINRIQCIRNVQQEVPPTFQTEIFKWSLECTCAMMFNSSYGFLDVTGLDGLSERAGLLNSVIGSIDGVGRCEFGLPIWKIVETPGWTRLVKHLDVLSWIFNKRVHKTQECLRQKKDGQQLITKENTSFLEMLLLRDEFVCVDPLTILLDMTLVGVNALTHAITFLLYHLSRYPRAQQTLYNEIKSNSAPLDGKNLTKLEYMRSCIKESLRLKQPIPVLNRILFQDTLIGNYYVPQHTRVILTPQMYGANEEYFEDALRFKPERWLKGDLKLNDYDLSALPFGLGARSCCARDLAEMQIAVVLFKIIGKYHVEYQYGEINSTNKMLAGPNRPLKFTFVER